MSSVTYSVAAAVSEQSDNGGIVTPPKRTRKPGGGRKPTVYTPEELQERLEKRREVAAKFQREKHRWLVAEVARLSTIEEKYKALDVQYNLLLTALARISAPAGGGSGR